MLKNLSPVITGDVLRHLDRMQPGELLAIVSGGYAAGPIGSPVVDIVGASVEGTAEAVFSVLPLAQGQVPILSWMPDGASEDALDVAFAVQGLASDAEARPIEVRVLEAGEFAPYVADAAVTFRVSGAEEPSAFLIRAGQH